MASGISITSDSEMKLTIGGVSALMDTDFIYGAMLGEMVLKHSDNLSHLWETPHSLPGQTTSRRVATALISQLIARKWIC